VGRDEREEEGNELLALGGEVRVEHTWNTHETHMEHTWNTHGTHMEHTRHTHATLTPQTQARNELKKATA